MSEDFEAARLKRLEHVVFGNGEEGMSERLRTLERHQRKMDTTLQNLSTQLQDLSEERAAFRNQISGARWAFGVLVALITVGGGGFALRIIDILITLQDAVKP